MNLRSRRSSLFAAVAVTATLVLAACGSSDSDDSNAADIAGISEASGGTLRVVVTAEPRSLNQSVDNNNSAIGISKLVSERLMGLDPETGEPVPGLVESADQTDDVTWTLTLAEGVEFTNGEAFDADAAVFGILTTRDTEGPLSPYVAVIEDAVATDEATVTVTTTEPIGFLPSLMTFIPALPPAAYEESGPEDFGRNPIGTGPFMLDEWASGRHISLVPNPDWRGEAPALEGVQVTWNGEAESRVALLETGEADIVAAVPPQFVERVENGDGLSIIGRESSGVLMLQPNTNVAPFDDVEARQAAAMAIDRDALVETVFSGVGATSWQSLFGTGFDSGVAPEGGYTYDPDAASEIVEGLDDKTVEFYWPNGRYLLDNLAGEAIAGMLEDVGFTVERNPMEAGAFFELLLGNEMPGIHMFGLAPLYPHESNVLNSIALPTSVVSYCAQDSLVDPFTEALALTDEERTEAYTEIARQMLVDEVCPIPLYVENQNWGVSDEVEGFVPSGTEMLVLDEVTKG